MSGRARRPGGPGSWGVRAVRACAAAVAAMLSAAGMLAGCTWSQDAVPRCGDFQRMAIIAQSVPTASYVPCIRQLPQGWSMSAFDPARGRTRFALESDRAPGRPVRVELRSACAIAGASPVPPRVTGVVSYVRLRPIGPDYAGTAFDVFPGGCLTYHFGFALGPHIPLMEQWQSSVGLYPRNQLRLDLRNKLGVELDP